MINVERRVDWAEQRLNELWAATDAYLEREPVEVLVEDAGPGSHFFRGYVWQQPRTNSAFSWRFQTYLAPCITPTNTRSRFA